MMLFSGCPSPLRYTVETGKGTYEGNLYAEMNRDMRLVPNLRREESEPIIDCWAPLVFHLMSGLRKCPKVLPYRDKYWRARSEPANVLAKRYQPGAEVCMCSFTSCTKVWEFACIHAGYDVGTVLEFELIDGYVVDAISVHPEEFEVIVPPNVRFLVMGGIQVRPHVTLDDNKAKTYHVSVLTLRQIADMRIIS